MRTKFFRAVLAAGVLGSLSAVPARAQADKAQAVQLAGVYLKQAGALEKAGKYEQAAAIYEKAAKSFENAGDDASNAAAMEKSASMYEKMAEQLTQGPTPKTAPATPRAAADAPPPDLPEVATATSAPQPQPQPQPQPARAAGPALALEKSAIVGRDTKGRLANRDQKGLPVEGTKLSRHDRDIYSPSIAVGPDGTIHVVFVEQQVQSPYALFVYHRSSRDGGKTWTDAKNLSEALPGYVVGNCAVVIDAAGRVYAIWHTGVAEGYSTDMDAHGMTHNNLVYRVLQNGAWSAKVIPVHPMFTKEQENAAGASWFARTDAAGRVHVIWNMRPDTRHPEAMTKNGTSPVIGNSMVMDVVLDGSTPGAPREIFNGKIAEDPSYRMPGSDMLDTIDGYVDAAGQAHFIAHVTYAGVGPTDPNHRIHLIEGGTQTPVVNLPNSSFSIWRYPPRLLVDARGTRHIIAMYEAGEQPAIRDYVVGSDAEPTIIRSATEVKGKIMGLQAFQGPGGHMIVLMEMNDTGEDADAELYVSTSDGGAWSPPVNVTNNSGRQTFSSKATTKTGYGHVDSMAYWFPGDAAATYDRDGHLVIAYISKKYGAFQSMAGAWTLAGGSSVTPNLMFLRF